MDDSGTKQNTNTRSQEKEVEDSQRGFAYDGNVFSPAWIRRTIQARDGSDWFILGRRYRFLFCLRLFLVILYIAIQTIK